ncbi:MAG: hypothetical protein K6A44_03680 [bacterium]|nr:hypothetical protein [bacterium]
MKLNGINSQYSFGWNQTLHTKMTMAALEQVPVLGQFREQILLGATYPRASFHIGHIFNPLHCYYGKGHTPYPTGEKHALDRYINNLQDSVVEWEFDEQNSAMRKLGEALHLLQDVAEPLHTQKGRKSITNIRRYHRYANITSELNMDEIMIGKPLNATTDNLYDLFGATYFKSANSLNPLDKKNSLLLPKLSKRYVTEACSASVAFLKRLENLHTMSDAHKTQAIESEFTNSEFISKLKNL